MRCQMRRDPGAADHAERVAGRLERVDHDGARRTELLGLLELVGPAAVVGARLASKQLFSVLLHLRIVVE